MVRAPLNFDDNLGPVTPASGFAMDGYWIWCPSVVRGDDGMFHMFASRWPKHLPFSPFWLTHSEVVRATSSSPEGPYHFEEVILPARGEIYWDGCMTHNPSVRRSPDGTWLLFYTGTSYRSSETDFPSIGSDPGDLVEADEVDSRVIEAHRNQRIGLATASSLEGPWLRSDRPVLMPREGSWDALITTNPAPCVRADGSILLLYKSVTHRGGEMHLGVCCASSFEANFTRLSDLPVLTFGPGEDVEDPFVWYENGYYFAIMKDMEGGIGGEVRGGVWSFSEDGVNWELGDPPKAYSRSLRWVDGTLKTHSFLERPGLIFGTDGRVSHFTAATASGSSRIGEVDRSWNLVIPFLKD